jgi:hypothetical protein
LSANHQDHGGRIDLNVADFERAGRKRTFKAAQHSLNASHEFARTEGLGDVIIGSNLEAEDAVSLAAFGGQENNRHGRESMTLADGAA